LTNNEFAQTLIEVLLSWMRLITGWVWNFFQADMAGGFLSWFADNWLHIALVLIIIGLIVDWLIWMIRWRPYWLWLRKRQIIYEEVESPRRRKAEKPQPVRHMPRAAGAGFEDPFAVNEIDPYAPAAAQTRASEARPDDSGLDDWDAAADPYAVSRAEDDAAYARPSAAKAAQADKPPRRTPLRRAETDQRGNGDNPA